MPMFCFFLMGCRRWAFTTDFGWFFCGFPSFSVVLMDVGLTGWDLVHGNCRDAGKSFAGPPWF